MDEKQALFANHVCTTFRAFQVNTTLTSLMRFFIAAFWADTISARAGTWFVPLTAAAAFALFTHLTLTRPAAKNFTEHHLLLL
jgi:hypothetical protein